MNARFSTPALLHLLDENATHPSGLFLKVLDGVANASRYPRYPFGLRLARAFKNSPLGRVQLSNLE
jgi:hypothetical protein